MSHGTSNHIKIKYNSIQDQDDKEKLKIEYCKTEIQFADIIAKSLKKVRSKGLKRLTRMKISFDLN